MTTVLRETGKESTPQCCSSSIFNPVILKGHIVLKFLPNKSVTKAVEGGTRYNHSLNL